MIENKEIIEQLSTEQKIALVSDIGALKTMQDIEGLARVELVRIDKLEGERTFPTYAATAYCWDKELSEKVFAAQARYALAQGTNALFTPRAGVRSTPLSGGVSEDPYVAAATMERFIKATKACGVMPVVGGGFNEKDTPYMDDEFSPRAFYEYFMEPFARTDTSAFAFPYRKQGGKHGDINVEKVGDFLHRRAKEHKGYVLCRDCAPDQAVRALNAGNILLGASSEYVRRAVRRFLAYQTKVERGEMDCAILDEALTNHTAFSIDQLDEAVDRVLQFAKAAEALPKSSVESKKEEETATAAAEESVVLLKNAGDVLPLNTRKKLTVIGAEERIEFLTALADSFKAEGKIAEVGCVAGYTLNAERSDVQIEKALTQAKGGDVVLLLENPKHRRDYRLPANQLALLDGFKRAGIRVVAVLCGEKAVDMRFEAQVSGLLLCPTLTKYSPLALKRIIVGHVSPSGRLTNTYYVNTEEYFKEWKQDRKVGHTKVGTFVGYRHYDTVGVRVKYPFGYGLSYASFAYSYLNVSGSAITVMVKNTGRTTATEVVQVYVGKKDSALVRPKKQLKGFARVTLKAGENKLVRIEINPQTLAAFYKDKYAIEGGAYEVYVGSSVTDIRLSGVTSFAGERFASSGERRSDYLQSQSNLLSGGYTMARVRKKTQAGKKLRAFGGVTLGLVAFGAVILALLWLAGIIDGRHGITFRIAGIGLTALLMVGLITWLIGIRNGKETAEKETILSTGTAHETQKKEKQKPYRELFDMLYQEDEKEEAAKAAESTVMQIAQEEFVGAYDPSVTFTGVCESLTKYITARGIVADKALARKLLAAFSASRIVAVKSNDKALTEKLLQILSEFFGGHIQTQNVSGAHSFGDVLHVEEGDSSSIRTLMEGCREEQDAVHIQVFDYDNIEDVAKICAPLLRFADRRTKSELFVYNSGTTQKLTLYPNLWFLLTAEENVPLVSKNIPFNDALCTLCLQLDACEEGEVPALQPFNFYQLLKMEQTALRFDGKYAERNLLDEDKFWKKLDRIEHYLSKADYSFSSKLNASLERFATVFLACDGEQELALDNVVACKLAVTAMGLTGEELTADGGLLAHLNAIFGDEAMDETKRIIHSCTTFVTE